MPMTQEEKAQRRNEKKQREYDERMAARLAEYKAVIERHRAMHRIESAVDIRRSVGEDTGVMLRGVVHEIERHKRKLEDAIRMMDHGLRDARTDYERTTSYSHAVSGCVEINMARAAYAAAVEMARPVLEHHNIYFPQVYTSYENHRRQLRMAANITGQQFDVGERWLLSFPITAPVTKAWTDLLDVNPNAQFETELLAYNALCAIVGDKLLTDDMSRY